MVIEHVVLDVTPGQESEYEKTLEQAIPLIASADGFCSLRMLHGIESPSRYILLVEWESVEAHEQGFRASETFQEWRSLLHHFYVNTPQVEHFTVVRESDPQDS